MREVARDFPDLSDPIFELFQAYLRATDIDCGDEEPPIDVAGNHQRLAEQARRIMMQKNQVSNARRTLDIHGAFVRRADLSGTSLRRANLTHADATNASFRDADFEGAVLTGTILRGADLTGAKNLTIEQLSAPLLTAIQFFRAISITQSFVG